MTDAEMLIQAVADQPNNHVVRLMALDELMELHQCSKTLAKKILYRHVQKITDARELAEAARELRPEGVWHDRLTERVRNVFGIAHNNAFSIVVIEGSAAPRQTLCTSYHDGAQFRLLTVTISAAWVLEQVALFWWELMEYAQLNAMDETTRRRTNLERY